MTNGREGERYPVARAFDDMLDQCQWLAREQLRRLQDASLKNILRHAYKTVPYYANILAPLFKHGDEADLTLWKEVPFLERRHLQDHFEDLKSRDCPEAHGEIIASQTSGSTAEPVKFLTTQYARVASAASNARGQNWARIDYRLTQAQIAPMSKNEAPYPGVKMESSWAPFWYDHVESGDWYRLDHATDAALQLAWLKEKGRCYVNSMPTNLRELVRLQNAANGSGPYIAGVLSLGEAVTQELRDNVREAFGCEIFDGYSNEELGSLAWQCSKGTNLHFSDELHLVEIIDDETCEDCKPGESGSVVVTSFYNHAMPLIRYKLGDIATVGEPCKCGRNLTSIEAIKGRERQMFRRRDGTRFMPGIATTLFADFLGARKWQIAQIDLDTIEVRFVSETMPSDESRARFAKKANSRFEQEFRYEFEKVQEIPRQSSGKFFEYVCELPDT